ncbi:MAG TPA: hypothetical protein VF656_14915 [Pyrinomonadaceae bacterium]|jgi:hypothetical protein
MAKKKDADARKPKKSKTKKDEPQLPPAVPPADNPLLRFTEFDADRDFHSKEMAERRLEAIEQTRRMPTSEEESPADAPEPHTSSQQPGSQEDG